MNELIKRQMQQSGISSESMTLEMKKLLEMVSDSYDQHERDRQSIESAMEASAQELRENYGKLQKQEALTRSNEKLQQFVSIASHDLKAPLRTVGAFTQLLHRKVKSHLDESGQEYVKFILDGVDRMNKLIEDLICFSKIDILNEEPTMVDVNLILEKVKRNLHSCFEESSGQLIIEKELPHILGLEFQLIQLLQNLIGNALKFRGDVPPVVSLDWTEEDEHCCIKIHDNGIGIAEENKEKVFEVFQRLNNVSDFEGSGLGLSICRKVVDSLDGKIWLESEQGKGTTFYINIPKDKVVIPVAV